MNELMIIEGPSAKRMTSLEISELVESRHDKVKQSIERLAARAVIELPPMGEISTATKPVKVYRLDKRSSLIVVAQLSPEFTARVVDRWQELEAQVATPFNVPATLPEALRLAANLAEKNGELQQQIETDRPKVELATAIEASPKSIRIGDFVKVISSQTGFVIGRNNFYRWLRWERIVSNANMPMQQYIDNGWFEVRESTYENVNTNGPQVCFTTLITGVGQIGLLKKFKRSEAFQKFLNKEARVNTTHFGQVAQA